MPEGEGGPGTWERWLRKRPVKNLLKKGVCLKVKKLFGWEKRASREQEENWLSRIVGGKEPSGEKKKSLGQGEHDWSSSESGRGPGAPKSN